MAGPRLLCIGDDPALGLFVQRQLQPRGYEVGLARGGAEGLARIAEGTVDAVLLEQDMPGQEEFAVLDAIVALPDPPPVIFVAAARESGAALAALKAGAADYVVKHIGDEFVALLEGAISSAMRRLKLGRERAAFDRETRLARDRFEALAAERQVLMREVNHRVGNSLQLVGAFLHLQGLSSASQETREALAEANRRVLAVAQVHRRLHASEDVQVVALESYLAGLIDDIRQSTDAAAIDDFLSLDSDRLLIDADTAVTIGVIVTELVINAMKHANPKERGPIRVSFKAQEGIEAYRLSVEDGGTGNGERGALISGVGKTIIQAMASKLETTVTYDFAGPGTRSGMIVATAVLTGRQVPEVGLD